jgi:hypothetical protein
MKKYILNRSQVIAMNWVDCGTEVEILPYTSFDRYSIRVNGLLGYVFKKDIIVV